MSYWPGDDINAETLQSEEYKKLSTKRLSKVLKFARSKKYTSVLLKACVSSIPRWRYVREMDARPITKSTDPDDSDDEHFQFVSVPQELRGIARGQRGPHGLALGVMVFATVYVLYCLALVFFDLVSVEKKSDALYPARLNFRITKPLQAPLN